MTEIVWDQVGERLYETGVDHGVLYKPDNTGEYTDGVAWNGLTTITESPSGAESNKQYADNTVYVNLISAEEFGFTIEAFTYPDEFGECDGSADLAVGVSVGQQGRKQFGLAYRTQIGNDQDGSDHGFRLHLVYGAQAAPSEKAYATINDSPEAISLSWECSTTPIQVAGHKATALLTIDSTKADADALQDLLDILYGVGGTPRLPLPAEVLDLFEGSSTTVDLNTPANKPTYNAGTHVVTLPAVTGVQWKINGVNKASGAQPALSVGQVAEITAHPQPGYILNGDDDYTFEY